MPHITTAPEHIKTWHILLTLLRCSELLLLCSFSMRTDGQRSSLSQATQEAFGNTSELNLFPKSQSKQPHHQTTFLLHKIPETIQIFKAKAYVQTWKLFKLLNATNVYQTCNSLLMQITSVKSGSYSSATESLISSFSKIKETPTRSRCFCKSLEGENAA